VSSFLTAYQHKLGYIQCHSRRKWTYVDARIYSGS